MKISKKPLGARVDAETQAALKRIAATEGISINQLVERILVGHLSKRQQGKSGADWEGGLRDLEQWIADQFQRQQHHIDAVEKRFEKSLTALRVMVDTNVELRDPARMDEYRRLVAATLRQMGITTNSGNGMRQ